MKSAHQPYNQSRARNGDAIIPANQAYAAPADIIKQLLKVLASLRMRRGIYSGGITSDDWPWRLLLSSSHEDLINYAL